MHGAGRGHRGRSPLPDLPADRARATRQGRRDAASDHGPRPRRSGPRRDAGGPPRRRPGAGDHRCPDLPAGESLFREAGTHGGRAGHLEQPLRARTGRLRRADHRSGRTGSPRPGVLHAGLHSHGRQHRRTGAPWRAALAGALLADQGRPSSGGHRTAQPRPHRRQRAGHLRRPPRPRSARLPARLPREPPLSPVRRRHPLLRPRRKHRRDGRRPRPLDHAAREAGRRGRQLRALVDLPGRRRSRKPDATWPRPGTRPHPPARRLAAGPHGGDGRAPRHPRHGLHRDAAEPPARQELGAVHLQPGCRGAGGDARGLLHRSRGRAPLPAPPAPRQPGCR